MTVKQKNLRVFHIQIDSIEEFISYYNKNRIILKEFFLLIEGEKSEDTLKLLNDDNVCYKYIDDCNLKLLNVKKDIVIEEKTEPKKKKKTLFEDEKVEPKKNIFVYDRPIRSGEEITEDLPVSVFGRVNSGAKLFCSQSVSIFGEIDGLVQCDGEYLITNGITHRGHVIFNGEIIDREMLKTNTLQRISIKDNKLVIKEVC